MSRLREQLADAAARQRIVADASRVLDQEVADKSGLSGLAIKGGYKVVQGIKPGFVTEVVDALLDDFVEALEPLVAEAQAAGVPVGTHLERQTGRVADALLAITDRRAEKATRAGLRGAYEKLRPMAKKHVEAAAPRLGQLLQKYS